MAASLKGPSLSLPWLAVGRAALGAPNLAGPLPTVAHERIQMHTEEVELDGARSPSRHTCIPPRSLRESRAKAAGRELLASYTCAGRGSPARAWARNGWSVASAPGQTVSACHTWVQTTQRGKKATDAHPGDTDVWSGVTLPCHLGRFHAVRWPVDSHERQDSAPRDLLWRNRGCSFCWGLMTWSPPDLMCSGPVLVSVPARRSSLPGVSPSPLLPFASLVCRATWLDTELPVL